MTGVDDPLAWFEQVYVDAARGAASVPWDRPGPGAAIADWTAGRDLAGVRTVVVGCGFGRDAEHLASLGADVVAFDIAPSAIAEARARHAGSAVEYVVADLLAPPAAWSTGFALVVEDMNVQALAEPLRREAVAAVGRLVAPGGDLLVVEFGRDDDVPAPPGPPWPFTRSEVLSYGVGDLRLVELLAEPTTGPVERWSAHFARDRAAA